MPWIGYEDDRDSSLVALPSPARRPTDAAGDEAPTSTDEPQRVPVVEDALDRLARGRLGRPRAGRSALQAAEEGAEPGQHAVTGLADLDLAVG
jgi:hypothetical protein